MIRIVLLSFAIALVACDSQPDVSYIQSDMQFIQACTFCKPCTDKSRPLGCVDPGEQCVALCQGEQAWMTGFKGDLKACRCAETNDIWVFDEKTRVVELRQAPLDEYGNEQR